MGSKIACLNLSLFGLKIWHKIPPRRPQDAHMTRQDAPRRPQDGPKTPQDDPKTAQVPPRTTPRRPGPMGYPSFGSLGRWGTLFLPPWADGVPHFCRHGPMGYPILGRFLDPFWCQLRAILGHSEALRLTYKTQKTPKASNKKVNC